ncbi:MAG: hypothetical protein QOI53_4199, partial [Verrucomicrobiota bacterium]|nr:hypothetical protein [Verrucomicrobiota bacterium]
PMDTMPNLCLRVGNLERGFQPSICRLPGLASVICSEYAGRRDSDENSLWPVGVQNDGVQPHAARARLPEMALGAPHSSKFLPSAPAVRRLEEGSVLRSSVNGVWVGERRLKMPDAFELPGVLCAVVPLVGAGHPFVIELVPDGFPVLAAIIGALDHLTEPAARL